MLSNVRLQGCDYRRCLKGHRSVCGFSIPEMSSHLCLTVNSADHRSVVKMCFNCMVPAEALWLNNWFYACLRHFLFDQLRQTRKLRAA
jgi:hypothetical protein